MTLLELFRLLITEFQTIDDAVVQAHLDNADSLISTSIIETLRNNLIVYYAAFAIDISERWNGSKGQVNSMTVGGVSINYNGVGSSNSSTLDLDSSLYGRRYKSLLRSSTLTATTRSVNS